jgi:CHAD domain-containing protein
LRWLGEISGPLRDLDILAEGVKSAERKLPATDRDALGSLELLLARDRAQAKQAVLDSLLSTRHARLVESLNRFTTATRRGARDSAATRRRARDGAEAAPMPVAVIAAESIERAWKRLLRHGRAIDDSSPAGDVHQVRIDGKKLRYLLELFRSVYPDVDLGPLVDDLKDLQDCLGAVNDAAVQEGMLRDLADRLSREDGDATAALLLVGRLIERSSANGAAARRRFSERFAELRSKENRKLVKALSA